MGRVPLGRPRHPVNAYTAVCPPCAFVAREDLPDFIIKLPESWEGLYAQVSSNMRRKLRKAYQSLERDGFAFTLRVTEGCGGLEPAMARFRALHAARAGAVGMISHPDKFADTRERAFSAEYLQGAADRGDLRIFELEIDDAVVASRLGIVLGSDLWLHFSGFDPLWRNYGVMTVLTTEIIKWAFAQGVDQVNLSTGLDQLKVGWRPREVLFHNAVQVSPTPRALAAFQVFKAYEALGRARLKAAQRKQVRNQPVDQPGPLVAKSARIGISEAPSLKVENEAKVTAPAT
jgi:CelD/BcsL family acetyltransferase involved in cellulose biosynthesis